jgi:hypothetical protein
LAVGGISTEASSHPLIKQTAAMSATVLGGITG